MAMMNSSSWFEFITVVGVGAVGRQAAVTLAAMGARKLQLIDGGVVRRKHIGTQGFLADDVGRPKVHATADICQQVSPRLAVEEVSSHFRSGMTVGNIVSCCVGAKDVRSTISAPISDHCRFWGEIDISGETIRVVTDCQARGRKASESKGRLIPRTAGKRLAALPVAMIAASLLVHQFIRFRTGRKLDREIVLDLGRGTLVKGGENG
jgi:hypothetical protein